MSNYEDFDLDLKEIKGIGSDIKPNTVRYLSVCSIPCVTKECLTKKCSDGCPTPSIDYEHRSCRGPLNDGTIQINC